MAKVPFKAAGAPKIPTRAELDALRSARPALEAGQHLTMDGWDAAEVRRSLNDLAESRIRLLENRLEQSRDRLRQGHTKAQIRGRAKHDFGR